MTETDSTEEMYAYDEPTPADTVMMTDEGGVIIRMGEPPIPIGCGATCADEISEV